MAVAEGGIRGEVREYGRIANTATALDLLMRLGAAIHAGGDLAAALGVYRRATAIETNKAAPFVAVGNTLLEMGQINEAILACNSALARDEHDGNGSRGLARAYLMSDKPGLDVMSPG